MQSSSDLSSLPHTAIAVTDPKHSGKTVTIFSWRGTFPYNPGTNKCFRGKKKNVLYGSPQAKPTILVIKKKKNPLKLVITSHKDKELIDTLSLK